MLMKPKYSHTSILNYIFRIRKIQKQGGFTMTNEKKLNGLLRAWVTLIIALSMSLAVISMPACAKDEVYTNAVRLHVVANSDSDSDQDVKYKVRDEILKNISKKLDEMQSDASSFEFLNENKELIEDIAETTLREYGYDYGATVDIGIHTYPTRMYEDATLPAGEYKSVRVILGEGEGQNWWCVVYPPMCLGIEDAEMDDVVIEDDLTEEESIVVKSWILEFFNKETPQPNEKAKNRLLKWLDKLGGKS